MTVLDSQNHSSLIGSILFLSVNTAQYHNDKNYNYDDPLVSL